MQPRFACTLCNYGSRNRSAAVKHARSRHADPSYSASQTFDDTAGDSKDKFDDLLKSCFPDSDSCVASGEEDLCASSSTVVTYQGHPSVCSLPLPVSKSVGGGAFVPSRSAVVAQKGPPSVCALLGSKPVDREELHADVPNSNAAVAQQGTSSVGSQVNSKSVVGGSTRRRKRKVGHQKKHVVHRKKHVVHQKKHVGHQKKDVCHQKKVAGEKSRPPHWDCFRRSGYLKRAAPLGKMTMNVDE